MKSLTEHCGELALNRVHWTHAEYALRHWHPECSLQSLREAYLNALRTMYGPADQRLNNVFNPDLTFVRGRGIWLEDGTLQQTRVDNDAADGLPYCQIQTETADGEFKIGVDRVRRSQLKNRDPFGYKPIDPYRGITFASHGDSIPVRIEPGPQYPIELLKSPMPEIEALSEIDKAFPKFDHRYLKACLAAAICAEARGGQPPMVTSSGPTGSGKGEMPRLAASFLGEDAVKVQLCDDTELFMRNIGALVASGHRFLLFDEFGKISSLAKKLSSILQISSTISWRPLYENRRVVSPCRSAFFFPCVRFPDFLCKNAEFLRRTRHVSLHWQVPNWAQTSGGDTATWRDRTAENAFVANSLLTHVWRMCNECEFRFL